jgi:hypothetical protein
LPAQAPSKRRLAAAAQDRALHLPFDDARALLALAMAHQRMGRYRAAGALLSEAVLRFDELGCPPLAARARHELARIVVAPDRELSESSRVTVRRRYASGLAGGLLPARPLPASEGD